MTDLTELEQTADREARHGHRELVERLEAEKKELALRALASQGQADEALDRVAELEAKLAWQPIETAPKSAEHEDTRFGPMIVLASTSGHRAVGYWSDGHNALSRGWINPHDHLPMTYWNAFTHWMPLPAPPSQN